MLTPIAKSWPSEWCLEANSLAIQVHGGYGFCCEYPVEQFLRDEKIASIYEGANGIQALDLVGRKMGMKKGAYFMSLLTEMGNTVNKYKDLAGNADVAADVQNAVNKLAEMGMFLASCAKQGKFFVPINNAYPFLMMMGKVICGWLLLWQAGIAGEKLTALCKEKGVATSDAAVWKEFIKSNNDVAFYTGKIAGAKFFIKNILPEVDAAAKAIKTEDLSVMEIENVSFA